MGRLAPLSDQRGFTLVEVMVAVMLLIVGVLGAVSLIDGANQATAATKSREGGTNLAREILDGARAVDYEKLTSADAPGQLQTQPGLNDSDPAAGWQVARRGIAYTLSALPICKIDDGKDGFGDHSDGGFCASSSSTGTQDNNPDDFRRMDVKVDWSVGAVKSSVRQTTLIINPNGGLGPATKTFCVTGVPATGSTTCPGTPIGVVSNLSDMNVSFAATTANAATLHWQADDANSQGDATATPSGSSTSWTFDWSLKTVGAFVCGSNPNWTLDGNYLVSAQGFDAAGIPGQLKSLTVTVNRSLPSNPCNFEGGFNDPATGGPPVPDKAPVVDLQWKANPERDIVGYRVYRRRTITESVDPLVCPLKSETSCFDANPLDPSTYPVVQYYVQAVDKDPATGALREDANTTPITIDLLLLQTGNQRPTAPGSVTATTSGGLPTLSWTASTDPNAIDAIRFYRIYRDGAAYADRYDKTGDGTTLSYTDSDPGSGGHTYYVSAVDSRFMESSPTGPVAP
jgi:prepilin-type N-terminal cleavage/methylation domain-containing protein